MAGGEDDGGRDGQRLAAERAEWLAEAILPHEPALRRWLVRRMPVGMEMEDVIQEAYAVLAEASSVAHVRQPRAYLFVTARSVLLQYLRRAQVVQIDAIGDIERLEIPSDLPSPESNAASRQELRLVQALIRGLPEKCRQAFWMRRVEGCSQREIAERLNVSENTVEKHVGKGIRLLMEAMKHETATRDERLAADAPEEEGHARKR